MLLGWHGTEKKFVDDLEGLHTFNEGTLPQAGRQAMCSLVSLGDQYVWYPR